VPATGFEPTVVFNVNVDEVIVSGSIGSLNVAVTVVVTATFVAASAGVVETTVGAVVSGAGAVVNVETTCAASGLPETSFADVATVTV
jgi:hypothetical protein